MHQNQTCVCIEAHDMERLQNIGFKEMASLSEADADVGVAGYKGMV